MPEAPVEGAVARNPSDAASTLIACFVACESRHADRFTRTTFSTDARKHASTIATTAARDAIGDGFAYCSNREAVGTVVLAGGARGDGDADTAITYREESAEDNAWLESYWPGTAFRVGHAGDRRNSILSSTERREQDDKKNTRKNDMTVVERGLLTPCLKMIGV